MRLLKTSAALLVGTSLLAACSGGPQFTPYFQVPAIAGPAKQAVAQARSSAVPADPYLAALRRNYIGFADFELDRMGNFSSAQFHAERALSAAGGTRVEPLDLGSRIIPAAHQAGLNAASADLAAALANGGPDLAPGPMAQAVASFDCWMEQAEEDLQPGDIAACRRGYEGAMRTVNAAIAGAANEPVAELPDRIELDSDVVFGFDSADINPNSSDRLAEIARLIMDNPGTAITVRGHTDSVGSESYNLDLSKQRAEAVVNYLANQGANNARFTVEPMGESDPIADNSTAEGRAANRRVEILSNNTSL